LSASPSEPAAASTVLERPDSTSAPGGKRRPEPPLVVDLDGTLIRSDLLIESMLLLAKQKPLRLLASIFWLSRGRACFKHRLAQEAEPDITTLPYDETLIAYLRSEKEKGRKIILATGADRDLAGKVADHLGLFDRILASNGVINLSGAVKRDRLVHEYQLQGFDYMGDGRRDGVVREAARVAVSPADGETIRQANGSAQTTNHPQGHHASLRALRPQQWLKNLLVFVPLILAHRLEDFDLLLRAVVAFAAFILCASGGYLFNDLLDLPGDRHHPQKKFRPLAAGELQPMHALVLMLALPAVGAALALFLLPGRFFIALMAYYVTTVTYSLRLKDIVVLDVWILAGLYTLRALAGALAIRLSLSAWILAFFIFLFFSLALVKRYAELMTMNVVDGPGAHARAYLFEDRELLGGLGVASGIAAVLTLGIHIASRNAGADWLQFAWADCALLLYAVAYLWLMAHRGRIVDDPLAFALNDRTSRILIVLLAAIFIATVQP
jgi:4-hydroxybenzoate polyprenyltransferase